MNIAAASATIVATDPIEGEVFNQTFDLISTEGIDDWVPYFTEPVDYLSDLIIMNLPSIYPDLDVQITLPDAGNTVKCGACVLGLSRDIGATRTGASVGIRDESVKGEDDFGNWIIVERDYRRRASFTVMVNNSFVDRLVKILAGYGATPILYIGSSLFPSTAISGFYKDFNVEIPYPTRSICTLELESLT